MQLEELVVDLKEIVCDCNLIHAHTKEGSKSENLSEHTKRAIAYFNLIYKEKGLDKVFSEIKKNLLLEPTNEKDLLFDRLLVNTISFHDIGKINPEFQRLIMKNPEFQKKNRKRTGDTGHSRLSSAIYIDYFLSMIEDAGLEKYEKSILHVVMLMNAYVISRHHGGLREFSIFCGEFLEGGNFYSEFLGMEDELSDLYKGPFLKSKDEFMKIETKNKQRMKYYLKQGNEEEQKKRKLTMYTYVRLLYSLLVSSDYYATTEFENNITIKDVGNINNIQKMTEIYENTKLVRKIRTSPPKYSVDKQNDINELRNSMFWEAEEKLVQNKDKNIFFLEAPTGGGKSNIAMNCSFKLLNQDIKKIFYVYPFNTLVEQNWKVLDEIYNKSDILKDITVINSITPIKGDKSQNSKLEDREDSKEFYQKALLDRQFLNYPFVLTTHVSLFQLMFSNEKEDAISFYQLAGSVVVLDEIQSYKNSIWTEIMIFLEIFSNLLHMKIIIMSATLPRLDFLTGHSNQAVNLIHNRNKYFEDEVFKNRVSVSYELLESKAGIEELFSHILKQAPSKVKILVEFINKTTAEEFFRMFKQYENECMEVLCMTGDDNQIDRERILEKITKDSEGRSIVLIATQVIEAGVDIDMDIGYKDISKLDSDEQFLGRINRNHKKEGITYFFNIDRAKSIYGKDFRIEKQYTLENEGMRKILKNKSFDKYYEEILTNLKKGLAELLNEEGMESFINKNIGELDFPEVAKRMQLIEEDQWDMSIFIARKIQRMDGIMIDGEEIWQNYKELLENNDMDYSKKRYLLSKIKSKLNLFIYKIKKDSNINYNDRIGELYYIENGEQYFVDGRLDKELLKNNGALFIEW